METVGYSKTSVTIYQSTRRHMPEHPKPHKHHSLYLQRRRFLVTSVSVLDGTCNTLTLTSPMKPNKMAMKYFQYETRLPSVSRAKLTYAVENGRGKREGRWKWRHKLRLSFLMTDILRMKHLRVQAKSPWNVACRYCILDTDLLIRAFFGSVWRHFLFGDF